MCPRPPTPKSNSKDIGELEKPLRDRLYTMMKDAPAAGLVLVSGYRDPGSQWDLRHDRVPHGLECVSPPRGNPVTAIPYRSNHQKRKAADIGGRDLSWAMNNCHRYGLARTVPSESWHYEVRGNPSVRILIYPGRSYDGTAIPPPRTTLKHGDRGSDVKFMQGLLNIITPYARLGNLKLLPEDGYFGNSTAARVMEFERWARAMQELNNQSTGLLTVDGVATRATLGAITFWAPIAQRAQQKPAVPRTLKLGSQGADVKFLQGLLNIVTPWAKLGDRKKVSTDGYYGSRTVARVKEYEHWARVMQELNGQTTGLLAVDGVATPATISSISFWAPIALKESQ